MIGAMAVLSATLMGGVTSSVAPAESLHVEAMASTATGLSLAGTGQQTLRRRSPMTLNLAAGFRHPQWPWLEAAPGIQFELEDRVSFAVRPTLRAFLPRARPRLYGLVGAVLYVFPFTMHGVEAGFGVAHPVGTSVSLTADLTATTFIGGSDLMTGSGLAKIDLALGVRFGF